MLRHEGCEEVVGAGGGDGEGFGVGFVVVVAAGLPFLRVRVGAHAGAGGGGGEGALEAGCAEARGSVHDNELEMGRGMARYPVDTFDGGSQSRIGFP